MHSSLKIGMTYDDEGELAGFYLPEEDRATHIYVLGSSGVGKSKGLATWILSDIANGNGCGVIDPHGDLINDIVGNLEDFSRVVLVEMTDPENIICFKNNNAIFSK
jgi:DNA helicase HerA-like ATPase